MKELPLVTVLSQLLTILISPTTLNVLLCLQQSSMQTPHSHHTGIVFHSRECECLRIAVWCVHGGSCLAYCSVTQDKGCLQITRLLGRTGFVQQLVCLKTQSLAIISCSGDSSLLVQAACNPICLQTFGYLC